MNLPEAFRQRMDTYFAEHPAMDAASFYDSFDGESYKGIRINRLKVPFERTNDFLSLLDGTFSPVPWCRDGFYASSFASGKDPFYHAGAYYIQEPSAMLPAEILGARPGEMILDLCAAPGGKTTRIGADMRGEGLLVANEISEDRAKALLRNVELFGLKNTIITNESPENLAVAFPGYFDRILIDAPCSGEGMFRRDKNATKSWETYGPASCEKLQRSILIAAHRMLKPGGHIVYSTCTFNPGENEEMMNWFQDQFKEYMFISHENINGITQIDDIRGQGMMRIWPQIAKGDGHFCAHLKKVSDAVVSQSPGRKARGSKYDTANVYSVRTAKDAVKEFARKLLIPPAYDALEKQIDQGFYLHGDKIHLLPVSPDIFDRIRVVKMGDFPGEMKILKDKAIYTPSHAFALSLLYDDVRESRRISFSRSDDRLRRYLCGETVQLSEEEGNILTDRDYILIAVDGYSLGFAKRDGMVLKNLYPKAWRFRS